MTTPAKTIADVRFPGEALAEIRVRVQQLCDASTDPVMRLALLGILDMVQQGFALLTDEAYAREAAEEAR